MKARLGILITAIVIAGIAGPDAFGQSPGDTIGWTQYYYQCNGSTGRRMAVDDQGQVHFTWTCGDPYPTVRSIKYSCFDLYNPQPPDSGRVISFRNGPGYVQMALTTDDRAVLAFQQARTGAETVFCAIQEASCFGPFNYHSGPNRIGIRTLMWPYVTVDHSNRVHIITTTITTGTPYTFMPFGYTRSNNGGTTWTAIALVDTIRTISPIIVSSKVSDKVSIIYTHPADTTGGRNDVYYIQSADGITWNDFADKVNLTNYFRSYETKYAWNEVSAVYDFNDNLHIIWSAQVVEGVPNSTPYFLYPDAHLYHWDAASNSISSFGNFLDSWPSAGCDMGMNTFIYSRFSIASDSSNNLYAAYTSWDTTDCSQSGFANGDLYLQRSMDGGTNWTPKINLTNSHTDNCSMGDCASDIFPSIADVVGPYLNIFYLCDRAGTDAIGEFGIDDPMLFLRWQPTALGEGASLPIGFRLSQNYPNPFNARTVISYTLGSAGQSNLSIYNIIGQKVITLANGFQDAGEHKIIWDAKNIPSGVYYARLEAGEGSQTIKMILLK